MKKMMVALVAVLLAGGAMAQEKNFIDQNFIEVNGMAELEVTPDEIYLRININEKDNKGKISVEQQEREVFRKLKALNIDLEKNMTVQDQSADLKTYLLKRNTVQTSKTYILQLATATQVGEVFRALADAGVSDVNIDRTDISNFAQLRQQVRASAAKAAQENAVVLAEAVGRKAGKAIYIQDYTYNASPRSNIMLSKSLDFTEFSDNIEPAPKLEFSKTKITHTVTVRFALTD